MHQKRTPWLARLGRNSLLVGAVFFASQAFADTTDWSLSLGGLYTSGSTGTLTGTDIPTISVTGDGTPAENGTTLAIVDGLLNLTSGSYDGTGSWTSGGVFDVTGCIVGVTATVCNGSNNVDLLSDQFQSLQIVPVGGLIDALFGNVTGTLNAQVAAYFGVSTQFDAASFETIIGEVGAPGSGLIGTNLSGSIQADPAATHVPERWSIVESLAFFGLAFLLFAALLRFSSLRLAPTQ
jgi:hypothetical protein